MGRRRDQRVQVELPVRVFGTDTDGRAFTRLAHTIDVSFSGVRIAGIYVRLKAGDVIGVQHGAEKARFRVVWVGERGSTMAGELGLRAVDVTASFWGLKLQQGGKDGYVPTDNAVERRRHPRFHCDIGVKVRVGAEVHASYARCTDISIGGCYLETWSPAILDATLDLEFTFPGGNMSAAASVRTVHPAFGMGVQFIAVHDPTLLKKFIDQISAGPRDQSATEIFTDTSISTVATQPGAAKATGLRGRVLVAEDSRFLQNAYAYYLRRDNFDVVIAHDGEEALSLAASHHPDVIVLDLLMPKMGGVDALKLLKSDPGTRDIPVIVLSGLSHSNETKLLSAGAWAYLEKNEVGPEGLTQAVARCLQNKLAEPLCQKIATMTPEPSGCGAGA